jgi:hypothetical protein
LGEREQAQKKARGSEGESKSSLMYRPVVCGVSSDRPNEGRKALLGSCVNKESAPNISLFTEHGTHRQK